MDIKEIMEKAPKNKKIIEIGAGFLIFLVTVGIIVAAYSYDYMLDSERKTIVLSARSPETGNWDLPEITLLKGEPVVLKIKNVDTVTHGFSIPELGIGTDHLIEIKAGHVDRIELTPTKEGTYFYMCTVWCSSQHPKMVGKVIVTEK